MNIKVKFKSGEVVKVTDSLVNLFLMGCTKPLETMAVFHAATVNVSLLYIIMSASEKGIIPYLEDLEVKRPETMEEKERYLLKVQSKSGVVEINGELVKRILKQVASPFEILAFIKASQEDEFISNTLHFAEKMVKFPSYQETAEIEDKSSKKQLKKLLTRFRMYGLLAK